MMNAISRINDDNSYNYNSIHEKKVSNKSVSAIKSLNKKKEIEIKLMPCLSKKRN